MIDRLRQREEEINRDILFILKEIKEREKESKHLNNKERHMKKEWHSSDKKNR